MTFDLGPEGPHLTSRDHARALRARLLRALATGAQRVTFDLHGVLSMSDAFADELFAVLAAERGDEWFRGHIEVRCAKEGVRGAIVRAVGARVDALERGA